MKKSTILTHKGYSSYICSVHVYSSLGKVIYGRMRFAFFLFWQGDEEEWICDIYNAAIIYIEDDDCPAETDSFWIP